MKLAPEEQEILLDDIQKALPEDFAVFSPWTWLWLVEIFLLMVCGGVLIFLLLQVVPINVSTYYLILFGLTMLTIVIPNALLVHGANIVGLRSLKFVYLIHQVFAIGFGIYNPSFWLPCLVLLVLSTGVSLIANTVGFQAFALHRKKMADWRRDRISKNRAYRQMIAEKRQRPGNRPK